MNKNEVNYLISILKMPQCEEVYNYDVGKNYHILIKCFNKLFKNNLDVLRYEGANIILDKVIKVIWNKTLNLEQLSQEEGEVFLYALYYETQKELKIDNNKITSMEFTEMESKDQNIKRYGLHTLNSNGTETIQYNKELLDIFCSNNPDPIAKENVMLIICHEIVHSRQTQDKLNNVIDLNAYISSLEKVAGRQDKTFKDKNYIFTRTETDADVRGVQCLYNFINKHKLYGTKQLNEIQSELPQFESSQLNISLNHQTTYKDINDTIGRNLIRACSEYIAQNPTILDKYPLLSISHHQDGRVKTPKELLIERSKRKISNFQDIKELNKIYEYILDFHFYEYQEPYNYADDSRKEELYKFKEMLEYLDAKGNCDEFELRMLKKIALNQVYPKEVVEDYINRIGKSR